MAARDLPRSVTNLPTESRHRPDRSAENRDACERVQTVRENDAGDGLRLQIQRPITTDFTWARGRGPQVGNEERHRFHTGPSAALWVKSQVDAPPCRPGV